MEYIAYVASNPTEYLLIETDGRKSAQKIAREIMNQKFTDRKVTIHVELAD